MFDHQNLSCCKNSYLYQEQMKFKRVLTHGAIEVIKTQYHSQVELLKK
jgi:hypothetical protein